jgi:hypothetical protein
MELKTIVSFVIVMSKNSISVFAEKYTGQSFFYCTILFFRKGGKEKTALRDSCGGAKFCYMDSFLLSSSANKVKEKHCATQFWLTFNKRF